MPYDLLPRQETRALSLLEAKAEFMLHQRASRHAESTLTYYRFAIDRLTNFVSGGDEAEITQIDAPCLRALMLHLEGYMKPNSVHGVMRAMRALFRFLEREELIEKNPMARVRMPKLDKTILPAFTEDEIKKLQAGTAGKDFYAIRNRALVLILLDSCLRLHECSSLKVGDIDSGTGIVQVMGKGRKERVTRIGAVALRAYNRHCRMRGGKHGDPLWLGCMGPLTRDGLADVLTRLGEKVGVHAHPHKFRRTCALFMLRSGADVFSVQYLMGHSDLTVLRRYLAQTEADVTKAHERHSPVDSLGLKKP